MLLPKPILEVGRTYDNLLWKSQNVVHLKSQRSMI